MTRTSLHRWYTDKADEAAAFYASNIEPRKHSGRLNVRARIDQSDRKPPNRGFHATASGCSHDCSDIRPETEVAARGLTDSVKLRWNQ